MPYKFETTGYRRTRSGRDMAVQHKLPTRFMSVDALRGFDMFWIVGAGYLVTALNRWTGNPFIARIKQQLTHVEWDGFAFYDLIFPLFVFIVGVSAAFSLTRTITEKGAGAAAKRVLLRGLMLYLVGVFYYHGFDGPAYVPPGGGEATTGELLRHLWDNTRLLGVLNRIALAYTATGLLFIFLPVKLLFGVFASILLGYWGLMERWPIRDIQLEPAALAKLGEQTGETNVVKLVRNMVGSERFIEVFVDTPLAVCEERDVKGFYARARAGELHGFTGVDDPYEAPAAPEIVLTTTDSSPEESARRIVRYLTERGFLAQQSFSALRLQDGREGKTGSERN